MCQERDVVFFRLKRGQNRRLNVVGHVLSGEKLENRCWHCPHLDLKKENPHNFEKIHGSEKILL